MYQTGGKPFSTDKRTGNIRSSVDVRLMGDARDILYELKTFEKFQKSKLAIASRGDAARHEPGWADDALQKFKIGPNRDISVKSIFVEIEIYPKSKNNHFEALKQKCKIDFSEMIFFDDKVYNLQTVAKMGVTCVHTPRGLTREVWNKGMGQFPSPGKVIK